MVNLLKQLFCNHKSQRCISNFDSEYVDRLYTGKKNKGYSLWRCERCGKYIKKPINEAVSTFNWVNITIKGNQ